MFRWIVPLVAVASIPVALTALDSDINQDGSVDLEDYAVLQEQFTGPREVEGAVYLVMELPTDNVWRTITNPRADLGEVFYITAAWCTGAYVWYITLPPEFADPPERWYGAISQIRASFPDPIPFLTSLDVRFAREEPERTEVLVLLGYYSSVQPVIEHLDVE